MHTHERSEGSDKQGKHLSLSHAQWQRSYMLRVLYLPNAGLPNEGTLPTWLSVLLTLVCHQQAQRTTATDTMMPTKCSIMQDVMSVLAACDTGGSGFGSQSMRSSGGSGVGRFSHGHTSTAGSTADWGSGNWSPTSAGQSCHCLLLWETSCAVVGCQLCTVCCWLLTMYLRTVCCCC